MNKDNINAMIAEALAIEQQSAIEAGTVSYMARAMVQATMPHSKTTEQSHIRKNGTYKLIMTAVDPDIGLPYGSLPRLMLAFIGAEVMRKNLHSTYLQDRQKLLHKLCFQAHH